MFPCIVDHRYTFEASLALYHSSRSTFRNNSRGCSTTSKQPSRLATSNPTSTSPSYTPKALQNTSGHHPKLLKSRSSTTSSETSDLSIISEAEESNNDDDDDVDDYHVNNPEPRLRRTFTTMSGMKNKVMNLNFLKRRKTSDA